jgi:hypothetical protein
VVVESLVIIAPQDYGTQLKAYLGAKWEFSESDCGVCAVQDGNSRVYLARNDSVWDELEPEDHELILAVIPEPVFYTLDFNDLSFCRRVLPCLIDDPKLLVDNDHGVRLPGPEFARILREKPSWNWVYGK